MVWMTPCDHSPVCETMQAEKTGVFLRILPTCAWAMLRRMLCFSSLILAYASSGGDALLLNAEGTPRMGSFTLETH